MRRAYGVRMRMLHNRTAMWGDADKLDGEIFCYTGGVGHGKDLRPDDDPDLAVVDILAKKCMEIGRFDLDIMRAEYERLTAMSEEGSDE